MKILQDRFITDYIKRYFGGLEMPTTTDIILLEPDVLFPETNKVPHQDLFSHGSAMYSRRLIQMTQLKIVFFAIQRENTKSFHSQG
jgi:hypothetical protein